MKKLLLFLLLIIATLSLSAKDVITQEVTVVYEYTTVYDLVESTAFGAFKTTIQLRTRYENETVVENLSSSPWISISTGEKLSLKGYVNSLGEYIPPSSRYLMSNYCFFFEGEQVDEKPDLLDFEYLRPLIILQEEKMLI
jgi:hypothetical protein